MVNIFKKLFYKYIGRNTEYYNWYLINMLIHPNNVYETNKLNHSLTQQWHRRDHSITKIVVLLNIILSILFAITFVSPVYFIIYVLFDVGIPLIMGVIISVILFYLCKGSFTTGDIFTVRYSYDIHINSYYCYLFVSHIIIFIFSPILFSPSFSSTLLSNIITLISFIYYGYVTYLGYNCLPFIKISKKALIIPSIILTFTFILFSLLNLNVALIFI